MKILVANLGSTSFKCPLVDGLGTFASSKHRRPALLLTRS